MTGNLGDYSFMTLRLSFLLLFSFLPIFPVGVRSFEDSFHDECTQWSSHSVFFREDAVISHVGQGSWEINDLLGLDVTVLVVVKSFTQNQRNKRDARRPFVHGRRNIRDYSNGMIFTTKLDDSNKVELDFTFKSKFQYILSEPLGTHFRDNTIVVSVDDRLVFFDLFEETVSIGKNGWFNHIHTVDFTKDGKRILVTSTAYDYLLEIDSKSFEILWSWDPWENGWDKNKDGVKYTRSKDTFFEMEMKNISVRYVNPLENESDRIRQSTRERPCHLNSAYYDENDDIICSLSRFGHLLLIDGPNKEGNRGFRVVLSGIGMPHGFHQLNNHPEYRYYGCNTTDGSVVFLDEDYKVKEKIIFRDLPNVSKFRMRANQWIQNIDHLYGSVFVVVDMHRSQLFLIDIDKKEYRVIDIANGWSCQQVVLVPDQILSLLKTPYAKNLTKSSITEELNRVKELIESESQDLVDLEVQGILRDKRLEDMKKMKSFHLDVVQSANFELIGLGAFSPFDRFMTYKEYWRTLGKSKLPYTPLIHSEEEIGDVSSGDQIALYDSERKPLGIQHVSDIFEISHKDRIEYSKKIYGDYQDLSVDSVKYVMQEMGSIAIGGKIELLGRVNYNPYAFSPQEIRNEIVARKWEDAVAFRMDVNKIQRSASLRYMLELVEERYGNVLLNHPSKETDEYLEIDEEIFREKLIFTFIRRFEDVGVYREVLAYVSIFRNYGANMMIIDEDLVRKQYPSEESYRDIIKMIEKQLDKYLFITPLYMKDLFFCPVRNPTFEDQMCRNLLLRV